MTSKNFSLFIITVLILAFAAPELRAEAIKPNIIFILADDMGYGDPHCQNPTSKIPTPNLDRLALEGMTFTDSHTPSAVCTPTRYGFLMGRYCWRSSLKKGVLNGYSKTFMDTERQTIADLLKSAGYETAIVGKWHLGLNFGEIKPAGKDNKNPVYDYSKPVEVGTGDFGFDYSFIIPASLDFAPYYYVRNRNVVQMPTVEQAYVEFPRFVRAGLRAKDFHFENTLDDLLAEALSYIKNKSKTKTPFFLYFPLTAPHKPIIPHPRFQGKTDIGPYGDFVTQVDWTVGQVLKTLDDTHLAENTLVIFSSDNGSYMIPLYESDAVGHAQDETVEAYRADDHKANAYLRGGKADIWEGGHRTPFFARWPGVVKPASKCEETICLTDIFATCADITGAGIDDNAAEDSFSFLPLLKGEEPAIKRAPVIHHSASATFSIRKGKFKLVLGSGSGGREVPRGRAFEKPYQLFNIENDPSEAKNLIDENPKMAKKLEEAFQQIFDSGASRKIKAKKQKK